MENTGNKPRITYFYDAICGWCYGFSPVMARLYEDFKEEINFEIVSGGLALGKKAGPIDQMAPYIKAGAYKDVEKMSGVKFGDAFVNGTLQKGEMVLNSEPPAIALSIVKEHRPEQAIPFGGLLHKAVYFDGMEPEDIAGYGKYAAETGLDEQEFTRMMGEARYLEKAREDFQQSAVAGVGGFPTLMLSYGGKSYIISRGYAAYEALAPALRKFLAESAM